MTRRTGRSPDSPSGSKFTLADCLADFLVSGRARGLSPKTLDWYAMIGERFAAFRISRDADPALIAMNTAEARAFVVSLQEAVDSAVTDHLESEERLLSGLDPDEREQLAGLLRKMLLPEPFRTLDPATD
ncbi:MAG: hypothetical protein M3R57_04665, partial [Chloroflexota bacterium]|nr:hypothetical protein [Chloroflexota bacterium]